MGQPRVLDVQITTTPMPHSENPESVGAGLSLERVELVYEITDSADDGISYVTLTLDQIDTIEGRKCYDTAIAVHNNDHLSLRDQVHYINAALDHFYSPEGFVTTSKAMLVGD